MTEIIITIAIAIIALPILGFSAGLGYVIFQLFKEKMNEYSEKR